MDNIKQEYLDYLRRFTKIRNLGKSTEFLFPLFDRNGDQISAYIEKNGDSFVISDDGSILTNLAISGLNLTGKRKEAIEHLCEINNITLTDMELRVESKRTRLPQDLHSFGQIMLQIDDMYITSKNQVASLFMDDVKLFFDENDVPYVPSIEIKGRSGLNQAIQFCFSKNRGHPERLCVTVNHATKEKAMNSAFIWEDIKNNRDKGSEFIVIVNDNNPAFRDFDDVLTQYDVKCFKFSELANHIDYFS
ncbi:DUF1828 domain-containing protein [Allobaculum sp. JKK-2023]|uniref:DUF1828 domain-containing protein n=1 Tax=Allobaculum sp. JKK-2023 TaxID=3108943 RepID=UPI002B057842|nr:DUF1828 domain-containing protein [Allobaculum sp. JKK-2023]